MRADSPAIPESRPTRPRDRRQTIAGNARRLFAERGFSAVRMEDIAAATGVTPRAVYRHFESKQRLLSEIVRDSQQLFVDALVGVPDGPAEPHAGEDLSAVLDRLVAASLASAHFAVLWQREARHLAPEDVGPIRDRLTGMAGVIAARIRQEQPGFEPAQAEIRAWAVLAIVSSPGHSDPALSQTESQAALADMARVAVRVAAPDPGPEILAGTPEPWSRREQLLTAAAALFARDGYQAVGINEIGARAGIAGPSIYRYFPAKADILSELVKRFREWTTLETARAFAGSADDTAGTVVRRLAAGYTRLCAEWPDLVAVSVTETMNLDGDEAKQIERVRGDLRSAWAEQVVRARPGLAESAAQRLVKVAMVLVEDTVRVRHLRREPRLVSELAALAAGVLLEATG